MLANLVVIALAAGEGPSIGSGARYGKFRSEMPFQLHLETSL